MSNTRERDVIQAKILQIKHWTDVLYALRGGALATPDKMPEVVLSITAFKMWVVTCEVMSEWTHDSYMTCATTSDEAISKALTLAKNAVWNKLRDLHPLLVSAAVMEK